MRYAPYTGTSTPGRVIMAWNSDVADSVPTTVNQVSQYQNSIEFPVWREQSCNFIMPRKPEFTVAQPAGLTPPGVPGEFIVATDQGPATGTGLGSFYLEYTIEYWNRAPFVDNV